jgi:hypothetical protein
VPITTTYPEHPDHKKQPKNKTVSDMSQARKQEISQAIAAQKATWEAKNPSHVE